MGRGDWSQNESVEVRLEGEEDQGLDEGERSLSGGPESGRKRLGSIVKTDYGGKPRNRMRSENKAVNEEMDSRRSRILSKAL